MVTVTYVKHVPDAEASLNLNGTAVEVDTHAYAIDGMDEYGVEAAVAMREAGVASEVVAVAIGSERSEGALRCALAMGADRAELLRCDTPLDALAEAVLLAEAVRRSGAQLLWVGGKQADWDSAALAPAVAELLGWPLCDWTTEVRMEGGVVHALHDIDDGVQVWQAALPVVLSTQQGLNEPRYPTLPNIMKAKRKPLEHVLVDGVANVTTLRAELPTRGRLGVRLEGDPEAAARELVRRLRDEARVI